MTRHFKTFHGMQFYNMLHDMSCHKMMFHDITFHDMPYLLWNRKTRMISQDITSQHCMKWHFMTLQKSQGIIWHRMTWHDISPHNIWDMMFYVITNGTSLHDITKNHKTWHDIKTWWIISMKVIHLGFVMLVCVQLIRWKLVVFQFKHLLVHGSVVCLAVLGFLLPLPLPHLISATC